MQRVKATRIMTYSDVDVATVVFWCRLCCHVTASNAWQDAPSRLCHWLDDKLWHCKREAVLAYGEKGPCHEETMFQAGHAVFFI